ncbi:MAG TPA: MBL fold metallo-hydrolase [Ignavibacteriaceae bacterium]|nr:MBL fold metallo-hydrolase [Ignavibacteriaceae bacterium]
MKIGKYNLTIVNTGYFRLDGGAMFGIIPRTLWKNSNPPDEQNRIKLATRNLLLEDGKRKILVDTGMGSKWSQKSKYIYDIDQEEYSVEKSLAKLNVKPEEITDVILTHLHFDHTGGSTKSENDKLVPTFQNAKYYVQKKNYEWGLNPSDRDRGSYIKENFVPLSEEGVLNFINGEEQFDDEIEFMIVNGHTFSQQLLKISDASNTILYCCDLFPTTSHVPLPYVMGYDLQPIVTVDEKKKILPQAVEENWKLFFEHDPETALATVAKTEKGFKVNEKYADLG